VKKKSKRWLAIILTIAMLLTMAVPAFAEEPNSTLEQVPPDAAIEDSQDTENISSDTPENQDSEQTEDTEEPAPKAKKAAAKATVADDTRTVLHEDGTLIINELAENLEVNAEQHGGIIREYPAWDGDENPYSFGIDTELPWAEERDLIQRVEIGSNIQPVSTALWFSGCAQASSADFTNLDMSNVTDTSFMFEDFGAVADSVTLSFDTWRTDSLSTTVSMFEGCGHYANKVSITGLENWNMAGVKNTTAMFASLGANAQEVILSNIDDWDFRSNGSMTTMFARIGGSLKIDFGKWDSPHADFSGMFAESKNLDFGSIHISNSYVSSMFARAENIRGKVFLSSDGLTGIDLEFALNTNVTGGALYLVPENKSAHNWAVKMESQYGLSGSQSQGHVYLLKDYIMRTVIYEDGTLIINESGKDQAANEAKHGAVKKEYPAWDGEENDYNMDGNGVPWDWSDGITAVEVGSKISPVNTSRWFFALNVTRMDLSLLDMSNVTKAVEMFGESTCGEIAGLENWDMSNVKDAHNMFGWFCMSATTPIELSGIENWKFPSGANLSGMFMGSGAVKFQSITIPTGCDISNMFNSSSEVYGELIIKGVQTCTVDNEWSGFAKNANLGKGALYLVPDDVAYSWAEITEAKYGPSGSVSQGHVYLSKMLDFAVTESIDMTGFTGSVDLTVTDLTVENLGRKEITVSSVQIGDTLNDWSAVAATMDFKNLAKDSKQFALLLSGTDLSKGAYTAGGSISADEQKVFKLTGKTGVVSKAIDKQQIANLVVTVMAAE